MIIHTSDMHVGHRNICSYRPFYGKLHHDLYMLIMLYIHADFRSTLIDHGDFHFTHDYDIEMRAILSIYEKVFLIGGNHCFENVKLRDKFYFDLGKVEFIGLFKKYNVWMSHGPLHPAELRNRLNFHGHTHDDSIFGESENSYVNCSIDSPDMAYMPRDHQHLLAVHKMHEWMGKGRFIAKFAPHRACKFWHHLVDIRRNKMAREVWEYARYCAEENREEWGILFAMFKSDRRNFKRNKAELMRKMSAHYEEVENNPLRDVLLDELAALLYCNSYSQRDTADFHEVHTIVRNYLSKAFVEA